MSDNPLWEHFLPFELDSVAVRRAVLLSVSWFVAWTGFLLYNGKELAPTVLQGAAFAIALGVIVYLTRTYFSGR